MFKWFIIFCLASTNAYASIGSVVDSKGNSCEIIRAKNKLPGNKGAAIESMDTFVTGNCVGNIAFKDDTKVKVTENSRLLIDDFVYDPKKSDAGRLAVKVALGTVRYTSGQIAKTSAQNVDVKTPSATIAVRGTDFSMTVDEVGQSLIILVPSCKDESQVKQYELQENTCRVGKIDVMTLAGSVTLEHAFEATYVASINQLPTAPIIINTIEGNISNNLIISKPQEVQRVISDKGDKKEAVTEAATENTKPPVKNKATSEAEEQTATSTLIQPVTTSASLLAASTSTTACNPATNVCVIYERPDAEADQLKGIGIAFRNNTEHYAEVKTQGYSSNSTITIIHDDAGSVVTIGAGDAGGNMVMIKQNSGVIKR